MNVQFFYQEKRMPDQGNLYGQCSIVCKYFSFKSLCPFLENMETALRPIVGRLQPAVVISQWCSGEGEGHANKDWSEVNNVALKVLL